MRAITLIFSLTLLLVFTSYGCSRNLQEKQSRRFTIVAVGDVVHPNNEGYLPEFRRLGRRMYAPTRSLIQSGDVSFANLEAPFSNRRPRRDGRIKFAADPEDLDHILWAGFNLFSLANNHSLDMGKRGVKNTLKLLEQKKDAGTGRTPLVWAGVGLNRKSSRKPAVFRLPGKNINLGFLSYANINGRMVNGFNVSRAKKEIQALKKQADFVIVSVHNGPEYSHHPGPRITRAYRKLVDAGADLILGHHSHVAQGVELYKQKLIFYSLGNFAMGTVTYRNRTRYNPGITRNAKMYSMVARLTFEINQTTRLPKTTRAEIFPIYTNNVSPMKASGQTLPVERFITRTAQGVFAQEIMKSIRKWSQDIRGNTTEFIQETDRLYIKLRPDSPKK